MSNKRTACAALAALTLLLCGCGSIFNKTYESVTDYKLSAQTEQPTDPAVRVKTFSGLKTAITELIYDGKDEGLVEFDPSYEEDVNDELASACWEIRSQNALCAYCVENISYEVTKIVSHYEAELRISYAQTGVNINDIIRLTYSAGISDVIKTQMEQGTERLAVFAQTSAYSAEAVADIVEKSYHDNPLSAPKQPKVSVNMFSGTGLQRLYEINIDYGMTKERFAACKQQLADIAFPQEEDISELSDAQKALLACKYLAESCTVTDSGDLSSAYSALIEKKADSEGLAHAYLALCQKLDVPCILVYGQYNRAEHCWNIITVDGENYHVDISRCILMGVDAAFMKNDQTVWNEYRWDIATYPSCRGSLTLSQIEQ